MIAGKSYSFTMKPSTKIKNQVGLLSSSLSTANTITVGADAATNISLVTCSVGVTAGINSSVALLPSLTISNSNPISFGLNVNLPSSTSPAKSEEDKYHKSIFNLTKNLGAPFDYTTLESTNINKKSVSDAADSKGDVKKLYSSTYQDLERSVIYHGNSKIKLSDASFPNSNIAIAAVAPFVNSLAYSAISYGLLEDKGNSNITFDSGVNDPSDETTTTIDDITIPKVFWGKDKTEYESKVAISNAKFVITQNKSSDSSNIFYTYSFKGKVTISINDNDYSSDDEVDLYTFYLAPDPDYDFYVNQQIKLSGIKFKNLLGKEVKVDIYLIVDTFSQNSLKLSSTFDKSQSLIVDANDDSLKEITISSDAYADTTGDIDGLDSCGSDPKSLVGVRCQKDSDSKCNILIPERDVKKLGNDYVILHKQDNDLCLKNLFTYLEKNNDNTIATNSTEDSTYNICVRQQANQAGAFPSKLTIANSIKISSGKVTPKINDSIQVTISLTVGYDNSKSIYWYSLSCDSEDGYVFDDYGYSKLEESNTDNKERKDHQISSDCKVIYGNDFSNLFNKIFPLKKIGDTTKLVGLTTSYEYRYAFIKICYDISGCFVFSPVRVINSTDLKSLVQSIDSDISNVNKSLDTLAKASSIGVGSLAGLAGLATVFARTSKASYGLHMYAQSDQDDKANFFALAQKKQTISCGLNSSIKITADNAASPNIELKSQTIAIQTNNNDCLVNLGDSSIKFTVGQNVSLEIKGDDINTTVNSTKVKMNTDELTFNVGGSASGCIKNEEIKYKNNTLDLR